MTEENYKKVVKKMHLPRYSCSKLCALFSARPFFFHFPICDLFVIYLTLAPIWFPHWPAWRWTISRIVQLSSELVTKPWVCLLGIRECGSELRTSCTSFVCSKILIDKQHDRIGYLRWWCGFKHLQTVIWLLCYTYNIY